METTITFLFCSVVFLSLTTTSTAVDTISINQTIVDGAVMESAGGLFQLGFFSPGNSKKRYLGIWYKKTGPGTVLWIANSALPLASTSGVLKIDDQGILQLMNGNIVIWSSNSNTSGSVTNPVAQLLDSGNLVVRKKGDINPDNYVWQSFDHPIDTLLPGMKLGRDFVKGLDRELRTWISPDDPSTGNYTCSLNIDGYPQLFVSKVSDVQYRLGSWKGMQFSSKFTSVQSKYLTDKFVINQNETYYSYEVSNKDVLTRMVLSLNGTLQLLTWTDQNRNWEIYFTAQRDDCNRYAVCGAYGSCYSTGCQCLKGFKPNTLANWSDGCTRKTEVKCDSDGFRKYSRMRLPDTQHSFFDPSINIKQCRTTCFKNCSCTAYANMDINGGTGCLLWFSDLIDMGVGGQDIYVRLAASELGNPELTDQFFVFV